jgi:hypothetical protein
MALLVQLAHVHLGRWCHPQLDGNVAAASKQLGRGAQITDVGYARTNERFVDLGAGDVGQELDVVRVVWAAQDRHFEHGEHGWAAYTTLMGLGMALLYIDLQDAVADNSPPSGATQPWGSKASGAWLRSYVARRKPNGIGTAAPQGPTVKRLKPLKFRRFQQSNSQAWPVAPPAARPGPRPRCAQRGNAPE